MRAENLWTVAKREYTSRIRTKGFWISTIALPLFMGAVLVVPSLILDRTSSRQELAVVDTTGQVAEVLAEDLTRRGRTQDEPIRFDVRIVEPTDDLDALRADLDRQVLEEEIQAWVWIDEESLAEDRFEYRAENVSNFLTQEVLEDAVSEVVREMRLADAGFDTERISELSRSMEIETFRVSAEGSEAEGALGGLALAFGFFFTLYMLLLVYGQQILQGVLEEKSSRIVEVVLAALTPSELLGGKMVGICLLGLTQLSIWLGTALILTSPGVAGMLAFLPEDSILPSISFAMVVHFVLHFLLGYFLYASFYAALGSAFNDLQEAQQLAGIAMIFIVAPVFFLGPSINDPGSTLAVVTSLIPPMTPLLMPVRIALEMPPWWQLALGYGLTLLTTSTMIWFAGRIYRTGILMYGKKPTIQEIWKWARHA